MKLRGAAALGFVALAAACAGPVEPTGRPVSPTPSGTPVASATATPPGEAGAGSRTPTVTPPEASPTAVPATGTATKTPIPPSQTRTRPAATVTPVAPAVLAFTISPEVIDPGQAVTLRWEVVGTRVDVVPLNALGQLSLPIVENGPLSGSVVYTTSAALRNQISFVLFVTAGGRTVSAGAWARITCPDTWFFPNPPADCPASPPHESLMAAQNFERGQMLWMEWNDFVYILFADQVFSPRWAAQANAWLPGMPPDDPSIIPPAGLYQPVRGFGVAWRDEQTAAGYRVRDRLGWATEPEFALPGGAFQCNSAPKYSTCFISGPGGVTYLLKPERSGWEVWTGPTPAPPN